MIAAAGGSNIRLVPYITYGTQELADAALKALEGRNACLLANHGMIVVGPTLKKAMWLAVEVETLAAQYWRALASASRTSFPMRRSRPSPTSSRPMGRPPNRPPAAVEDGRARRVMIVGIDVGTQSLKAAVTDGALGVRGEAAMAYRPNFPRNGWAEQDPRLWEHALGPTIARAAGAGRRRPTAGHRARHLRPARRLPRGQPQGQGDHALPDLDGPPRARRRSPTCRRRLVRARAGQVLDASHHGGQDPLAEAA